MFLFDFFYPYPVVVINLKVNGNNTTFFIPFQPKNKPRYETEAN